MTKRRPRILIIAVAAVFIAAALFTISALAAQRLSTPTAEFSYDGNTLYLRVTKKSVPETAVTSYNYEITDEGSGEVVRTGFMGADGVCSYSAAQIGQTYSATVVAQPEHNSTDYIESLICNVEPYRVGYEPISIPEQTLPAPTVNTYYSEKISFSAGSGKVRFAIDAGTLPDGLSLNGTTGEIYGTPTAATSAPAALTIRAYYNYDTAYSFTGSVTIPAVAKCPATIADAEQNVLIGHTLDLKTAVAVTPANSQITYALAEGSSLPAGTTLVNGVVKAGETEGSFEVLVTVRPYNQNYAQSSAKITVNVLGRETAVVTPAISGWTYGDTAAKPSCTVKTLSGGEIAETATVMKYEYKPASAEDSAYTETAPTDAGSYALRATFQSSSYYGQGVVSFVISPKALTQGEITVTLAAQSYPYTGQQICPPVISVQYGTRTAEFDAAYGENVNAGTGTVAVTLKGNYSGTKTVSFTIARRDISAGTLTLDAASLVYNGSLQCPSIRSFTVPGWTGDVTYSVGAASRQQFVGSGYTVSVSGTGNFTGNCTAWWSITPASQTVRVKDGASATVRERTSGIDLTKLFGASSGGTVSFTGIASGSEFAELSGNLLTTKTLTAGSGSVVLNASAAALDVNSDGKPEYSAYSGQTTVTVIPKEAAVVTIANRTAAYSGTLQKLYAPTADFSGGTWSYVYGGSIYSAMPTFRAAGSYTVTAVYEDAEHYGSASATLTIQPLALSDAAVSASVSGSFSYTGSAITPVPALLLNGSALINGSDFTITGYENNAGTAVVHLAGKGNFTGARAVSFTITARSVAAGDITVTGLAASYEYTGAAIEPSVTVAVGGAAAGFTASYGVNKDVSTGGSVTVTLTGNYTGTKTVTFAITPKDVTVSFSDYTGLVYNGGTRTIGVSVSGAVEGETVAAALTYSLAVVKNAGSYTATAAISNTNYRLTGTTTQEFTIAPKDVTVTFSNYTDLVYNGSVQSISAAVAGAITGETVPVTLSYGAGVTVKNAGSYTATASISNTNYRLTGTLTQSFAIAPRSITGAEVTLSSASVEYTGSAVQPEVSSVKAGNLTLTADDYDVSAATASAVGTGYSVTVTGKGNFTGTATADYAITARSVAAGDITVSGFESSYIYTGAAIKPSVTVAVGGAAAGFTASYGVNKDVSTGGSVTVTLTGNYTGTKTVTFAITPKDVTVSFSDYTGLVYNGGTRTIGVSVSGAVEGETVAAALTYSLAVVKNAGSYTATAAISNTNYRLTGTTTQEFTIAPKDVTVTFSNYTDLVYNGSVQSISAAVAGAITGETVPVTLSYGAGVTVKNAGSYTATASIADGNYTPTGTLTQSFAIASRSITGAEVTLSSASVEYTGSAVQPEVSSVKAGNLTLTADDYDVSAATASAVGTGYSVTVTGKGNFTGTATADYAITARSVAASDITVSGFESSYIYTGAAIKPSVTVAVGGAAADFTASYGVNKDVSTGGSVTVTLTGNYTGTKTVNFAIAPKDVTVSFSDYTGLVYNGGARTIGVSVSGAVGGETVAAALTYSQAVVKNAGSYTATATISNTNYQLTGTTTQEFVIGKITLTPTVGTLKVTKVYDGTTAAGQLSGEPALTGGILTGDTVSASAGTVPAYSGSGAGTYTLTVPVELMDGTNYTLSAASVQLTDAAITPAAPTAPAIGQQTMRRGNTLATLLTSKLSGVTAGGVSGEPVSGALTLSYGTAGANIDTLPAGTYQIGYSFVPSSPNYKTDALTGTFTLVLTDLDPQSLAFANTGYSAVYGQTGLSITAVNSTVNGGAVTYASSDTSVATIDGGGLVTILAAGQTTITASAAEVAGQYAQTEASCTLTVSAAAVSGSVTVSGSAVYAGNLTASVSAGGATCAVTWQRSADGSGNWTDTGASGASYTIVSDDVGAYLRACATASGNYTGKLFSAATGPVAKAQPAGSAAAPTVAGQTDTTVTAQLLSGQEYLLTNSASAPTDWSDAVAGSGAEHTFTGLTAAGTYYLYTRRAETATTLAGEPVSAVCHTAFAAPAAGTGFTVDYGTETITATAGYELFMDGALTHSLSGSVAPGQNVFVRCAAAGGIPASAATANALPLRPDAPTVGKQDESFLGEQDGVLNSVTGQMEYRLSGGSWTSITGTEVTGLAAGSYEVRLRATQTAFAGNSAQVQIAAGPARTYTLSVADVDFGSAEYGAAAPAARAVTITSTGNSGSTISSVAVLGSGFTISGSDTYVEAGGTLSTYTIAPNSGLAAGSYAATITVSYNSGASATAQVRFEVTKKTIVSSGVTLEYSTTEYSGTRKTPAVTVLDGQRQLTAGTDYTLTYGDNVSAGSGSVRVAGSGNYTGTVSMTFTITKRSASNFAVTLGYEKTVYTGRACTPEITVKDGAKTLSEGADYSVSYQNNVNAGQAAAVVTGLGGYEGSARAGFEIGRAAQSPLKLSTQSEAYTDARVRLTVSGGSGDGAVSFRFYSDAACTAAVTDGYSLSETQVTFSAAGVYYAKAEKAGGQNYLDAVSDAAQITVTEEPAAPTHPTHPTNPTSPTNPAGSAGTGSGSAQTWSNPYTDVAENAWYYSAVRFVSEKGYMDGATATTFAPNRNATRAEVVCALWRASGSPDSGSASPFTDVPASSACAKAAAWASQNRIVLGVTATSFHPNDSITREQLAAILYRYSVYLGRDVSASAELTAYTDRAKISSYALAPMKWAVAAGLMRGRSYTTIVPQGTATRAEIATLLMRLAG